MSVFILQIPFYNYKVKIINPTKKSDVIVRELHHFQTKFESVSALRLKLHDDFGEHVPSTTNFNVGGYFEGQQRLKVWLVTADDLNFEVPKRWW